MVYIIKVVSVLDIIFIYVCLLKIYLTLSKGPSLEFDAGIQVIVGGRVCFTYAVCGLLELYSRHFLCLSFSIK